MILILISEPLYHAWKFRDDDIQILDQHYADSLLAALTFVKRDCTITKTAPQVSFRFREFDPNTATEKEFIEMGLKPFLASRIIRYREKGGQIKKAGDLLRIYGMDSSWFVKAKPWISLPATTAKKPETKVVAPLPRQVKVREPIDINAADSTQLVGVSGIGPALSKRIRNYREKLGGFISMNQLSEVYGLDTTVLKHLKGDFFVSDRFVPRRVNLNTDSVEKLIHPYIRKREAYAIINYRRQHGAFASPDKLREIPLLTAEWLEKVRPYLVVR